MKFDLSISRRQILKAGVAGAVASPLVWHKSAFAAGQVIVRSPGGAPEENSRRMVWEPFEKETGIRVVPVPATVSKLFAMHKAGTAELDIIDINAGPLINLQRLGALAPIDYASWKRTNPEDIPASIRTSHRVGHNSFATVLGYNTAAIGGRKAPQTWAEFWDTKAFPGPRSLGDLAMGNPNLEAALLADGVPRDKIYPMDLDRAFASLTRIRDSIPKSPSRNS